MKRKFKHTLAERLEHKQAVAKWRSEHPEQTKQHYRNWVRKKRGTDYKPRKPGAYYGTFDKNFEKSKPTASEVKNVE